MKHACLLVSFALVLTATCLEGAAHAQATITEYRDKDYSFSFQYPSDWKMQKLPPPGEAGETRAFVRAPTSGATVMALVGRVGNSITKEQFEKNPNRQAAVNGMLELTADVHKQLSREMGASRIVMADKQQLPSDVGIKLYVTSGHVVRGMNMAVASTHIIPFGKEYVVIFVMIAPTKMPATEQKTAITVFNSFHVRGERPVR